MNNTHIIMVDFTCGCFTDREEPVPGYRAGDASISPPEDPGREGWSGRPGGLLGITPDSGKNKSHMVLLKEP